MIGTNISGVSRYIPVFLLTFGKYIVQIYNEMDFVKDTTSLVGLTGRHFTV